MEKNNQQQEEKKEEEGGDEDNEPSQQALTSTDDGIQLIVEDAAQIEAVDQTETDDDDNEALAKHSRGRTRPQAPNNTTRGKNKMATIGKKQKGTSSLKHLSNKTEIENLIVNNITQEKSYSSAVTSLLRGFKQ